ncbi:aldehyde dehydrogenase (NADP(+)) ald6 [Fusarium torreyae]|uniref:methylmalonate-semialdehyde dehydrogenase (CoA acylating) n=1 Tax=Fusarium torreyae TaxID=1237075 RepID=A0A9W8RIR3_9HYPO|nr:aldehyde dehydrogenase (NADP(+)) ald6 [Fusarium torreyae]
MTINSSERITKAYGKNLPTTVDKYPTSHDVMEVTSTPWFIDNDFVESSATEFIDNTDEELLRAVDSAEKAFPSWKATSVLARQQIMLRFVALIREHWDRLAAVITLEQGKTLADAKGDVLRGLQVAEAACGAPELLKGEVLPLGKDLETRTYMEPLGVVASICPFNFPAMIPLWSLPIAVVTGNTLILKPSERDPGAVMVLAELSVNFILDEPRIQAISFVGSNKVGEYVYTRGSANGKRAQANLGAKNRQISVAVRQCNSVVKAIAGAAFGAAGQRCMALSTLVLLPNSDALLAELIKCAKNLNVNGGFEKDADVGPVITPESKAGFESVIQSAEDEGATIGNWIGPTIITNVKPHMRCYKEEIFGPVLVCPQVDSFEEAIKLINTNEYGNGVAVFTESGSTADYFRRNIDAGQVGINVPVPVPLPMFSFTGNKRSIAGGGSSTFYGRPGVRFYTQQQTVTSRWVHSGSIEAGKAQVVMTYN